ncbi:MAG: AbrB/MazE/SpoVT family DNA-binding domain-containing protein [Polyangiaceae bacterium]
MGIEATSRVTKQNQISVPAEIRRHFGIGPGAELIWEEREGMLVVRKKTYTIEDVQAALGPPPNDPKTLKALRDAKMEHLKKKAARGLGR